MEYPRAFGGRGREALTLSRLALRLAWRCSPWLTAGVVLLTVLQSALAPAQLATAKAVVDRIVQGQAVVGWAVAAAAVLAAAQIVQPVALTLQALAGDRLTAYISEQLIVATNRWPGLARFEDPTFQDDLHRARTRAARAGLDVVLYGSRILVNLVTAVTLVAVLARLHPLVPLVLVATSVPRMSQEWAYTHHTGAHLYSQTPQARRMEYSAEVLLSPEPGQDVRLFSLGDFFRRRYDTAFDATTGELIRLRHRLIGRVTAAGVVAASVAAAVYVATALLVAGGNLSLGDFVLYAGAVTVLRSNMAMVGFDVGFLPEVMAFLPGLFRILDAPPDLAVPDQPRFPRRPVRQGVVFEEVSFTYPGRAEPALRGISLRIEPGQTVAVVGRNGAGKTTVVKLLLRLYDPDAGRILLDGVDLRDYDPEGLRREIGVIFQDFCRYDLSARDNIGLGCPPSLHDESALLAAAHLAGAEELVMALPDGLDTRLGWQFGGRKLSEGEWQKLALARALVGDRQLLVLDEPTASLDVETEYALYRRFQDLTRGRTTILISHRLSTVRMADRILHLAGGTVAEQGTHDELLGLGGRYAHLYRLQAAHYGAAAEEAR